MKTAWARWSVTLAPLIVLAGCGFRPVYMPSSDGQSLVAADQLAAVEVALLPERSGQILRQDVQERLERFGIAAAKQYRLSIVFNLTQEAIGIQPDTSSTFVRVQANATWTLNRLDPKATLLTVGGAHAVDGFNTIDLQVFASELEAETVQRKLAQTIADQIALQLAVYFKKVADASHTT